MSEEKERDEVCFTCKYWDIYYSRRSSMHSSDLTGQCRRNAPRPTLGGYEGQVLDKLSTMAFRLEDGDVDSEFNDWLEAELKYPCHWPKTWGDAWCGEWSKREVPIELDKVPPARGYMENVL